jgi:hypothetical protein
VDGAGPYALGANLTTLQATPGLAEVTKSTECAGNTTAKATGPYDGIALSFRPDGSLYLEVNTSAAIPTPSGAYIGTSLVELRKIYAAIPGQDVAKRSGAGKGYLVTTLSGRGVLFDLDTASRVTSMIVGDAAYLKAIYTSGSAYC